MRLFTLSVLFIFLNLPIVFGQLITVSGKVVKENGQPLEFVNILVSDNKTGSVTDKNGGFNIKLELIDSSNLIFSYIGYASKTYWINEQNKDQLVLITLVESSSILQTVKVSGTREIISPSITKLSPKSIEALPTPFKDFTKILATLPGVTSNNELSSTYSVRGGNFDENLVYVNDILIYRPFLITNGQQEGLSFVNTDMVESVEFSAGGWQSKYGDKLSSVLNVNYKTPQKFGASVSASLLGGTIHLEGITKNDRVNYVIGARHKSSQYLLNTLETQGQYLPKFTDFQSYINVNLGKESDIERSKLGILTSYARNRYFVKPQSRETEFGNFNESLRLVVDFEGKEILDYDTYQGGIKFTHMINDTWKTDVITSLVFASEREYTDVEGVYDLCDVDKNLSSNSFNECAFIRGRGTNYDYGRNSLEAEIINAENRNVILLNKNTLEFGIGYSRQQIKDQLQEYSFTDSADYVTEIVAVQSDNKVISDQLTAYVQNTFILSPMVSSTLGARINYWNLNEQFLFSPRWQLSVKPKWNRNITFTGAMGVYQQTPFFREMRGFDGVLNKNLKAQRSIHIISGMDYYITWWGRDFLISTELYYKRLRNVVPYEVDNVKVRYYANNDAKAFAAGFDLRVSGEFIEGVESWFSLGILNVKENLEGDGKGYIRRPSDQRINLGIFFQDHLPDNPDARVNLNFLYGSGLPFGAPGNLKNRNTFNGDSYTRIDLGFSRVFHFKKEAPGLIKNLMLSAEVLNLLGIDNAISYTWISDVNNDQFAVPNSLSARFLNLRITLKM